MSLSSRPTKTRSSLPTIDTFLELKEADGPALEIAAAALYKVEKDHCLFFTEVNDPRLEKVYAAHQREADTLAARIWQLNAEEYDLQWTHVHAMVLSGAFWTAFGMPYGEWRRSLGKKSAE